MLHVDGLLAPPPAVALIVNIGDVSHRILDLMDVGGFSRLPVVGAVDGKDVMVTQLVGGEEAV